MPTRKTSRSGDQLESFALVLVMLFLGYSSLSSLGAQVRSVPAAEEQEDKPKRRAAS